MKNTKEVTYNAAVYNPNDVEKCVFCGVDTDYKKGDHIDNRYNYVEGAGQLCPDCAKRVYG